jgi:hypothetical protein
MDLVIKDIPDGSENLLKMVVAQTIERFLKNQEIRKRTDTADEAIRTKINAFKRANGITVNEGG